MAPDVVATQMIFQEHYITLCQYISSRANSFTKVAEDPLNVKIYKNRAKSQMCNLSGGIDESQLDRPFPKRSEPACCHWLGFLIEYHQYYLSGVLYQWTPER